MSVITYIFSYEFDFCRKSSPKLNIQAYPQENPQIKAIGNRGFSCSEPYQTPTQVQSQLVNE